MSETNAERTSNRTTSSDGRRVIVAFVMMSFLVVGSVAALYQKDAERLEAVGKSVAADNDRSLVIPLARGMNGTPIHVSDAVNPRRRDLSVTLLDERMSGARQFRISSEPYEADATISKDFARYRVLRIAGSIDCATGGMLWLHYEIATDYVTPLVRTAPPLSRTPPGLPTALDGARTSLICEVKTGEPGAS